MENDTSKETTINDYLPLLYEKFPDIPKSDIKKIVEYGWRLLYLANLAGCDTLVVSTSNKFWFYIGNLCRDSMKHFNYYKRQLIRKIQFMYKRLKPEDDGYYYVGLTNEELKPFITKRRGVKTKHFTFNNKMIFKSKDACSIYYANHPGIIKFQYLINVGFKNYYSKLLIDNPELVEVRDSLKFVDLLVNNNNYELI